MWTKHIQGDGDPIQKTRNSLRAHLIKPRDPKEGKAPKRV